MIMKREFYLELEGFDEDCFMYSDDIDLSYRALKSGKSNYYFYETTIIHYKGESTIKNETYMKRFQEAMQFFYKKHFKVAPLFAFFMTMGTYYFSFAKRVKGQSIIKKIPESYLLYSSDEELANKLIFILQKKVVFHNLKTEKMLISSSYRSAKAIEIILDNEFISFKECIAIIESSKNKELTFKILPEKANFLIGSNNSNERGEIIKIK